MNDRDIVDLYWQRSERAIRETVRKYGRYCRMIAYNILNNAEDAEECVSDTWLAAWNSMPDKRPEKLNPFLAKITRNLALTRLKRGTAKKRGGGEALLAFEELDGVLPDGCDLQKELEEKELTMAIEVFVKRLPERERLAFLGRYWFCAGEKELAERLGLTRGGVNAMLRRTREKLKDYLLEEGLCEVHKL